MEGTPCSYVCELCGADDDSTEPTNEEETSLPADDPSDDPMQKDGQKTFTVAQVEAMIDALPDVEYVEALDSEEDAETLEEIYLQAADAADAFDTLSDEDREKVSNLDKLMELHEWFNGGVATMNYGSVTPIDRSNLYWELDSEGTLKITGTGDMPDWSSEGAVPWYSNRSNIKAVSIGDGVTSIGGYAFYFCVSLASVELPDSLTKIGDSAFLGCSSLKSITIPASVTEIGAATFNGCTALNSITIPAGVTTIGDAAFYNCTGLTSIEIPAGVTTIGGGAFYGCTGLTTVTFKGTTPPDIDPNAFSGCNITKIEVPKGAEAAYCELTESLLPKQLSGGSSKPVKKEEYSGSAKEVHSHSYSWVTVQAPGVGQDGIEEYRCSCGAVADRSVIPATQAAVSGMMDAIENAPAGGNISFDSGRFYTMSDKIIKKLAERSDVVTEITFEYQGTAYKMTIPAGIDYTAILADDERFYGYFYFAQLIGATIETR